MRAVPQCLSIGLRGDSLSLSDLSNFSISLPSSDTAVVDSNNNKEAATLIESLRQSIVATIPNILLSAENSKERAITTEELGSFNSQVKVTLARAKCTVDGPMAEKLQLNPSDWIKELSQLLEPLHTHIDNLVCVIERYDGEDNGNVSRTEQLLWKSIPTLASPVLDFCQTGPDYTGFVSSEELREVVAATYVQDNEKVKDSEFYTGKVREIQASLIGLESIDSGKILTTTAIESFQSHLALLLTLAEALNRDLNVCSDVPKDRELAIKPWLHDVLRDVRMTQNILLTDSRESQLYSLPDYHSKLTMLGRSGPNYSGIRSVLTREEFLVEVTKLNNPFDSVAPVKVSIDPHFEPLQGVELGVLLELFVKHTLQNAEKYVRKGEIPEVHFTFRSDCYEAWTNSDTPGKWIPGMPRVHERSKETAGSGEGLNQLYHQVECKGFNVVVRPSDGTDGKGDGTITSVYRSRE
jgi:hypothetical protein